MIILTCDEHESDAEFKRFVKLSRGLPSADFIAVAFSPIQSS